MLMFLVQGCRPCAAMTTTEPAIQIAANPAVSPIPIPLTLLGVDDLLAKDAGHAKHRPAAVLQLSLAVPAAEGRRRRTGQATPVRQGQAAADALHMQVRLAATAAAVRGCIQTQPPAAAADTSEFCLAGPSQWGKVLVCSN